MSRERSFHDLYAHGMARVAAAVPLVKLADPAANAQEIARLYGHAADAGAALVVFPELSLTGYSIDDLVQQRALLDAAELALQEVAEATAQHSALCVVGVPLQRWDRLFNCAVVLQGGRPLGVVVKSYLPCYREYYERRQFSAARDAMRDTTRVLGVEVPFGNDLIFRDRERTSFCLAVEMCEDLWVPQPPSVRAAMAGATVLANLSASNITVGKDAYRHDLVANQSARCLAAYVYAGAGSGESTTDMAWDGCAMVFENGELLTRSERYSPTSQFVMADVDLERLVQERARMTSFVDCATDHAASLGEIREIPVRFVPPKETVTIERTVERHPFVPQDPATRDERCEEVYQIQVSALAQRLSATGTERVAIGVSGGLDSTQALIVAARAMDRLNLPRTNVLAYSMPGFATSERTRTQASNLMKVLGVNANELDIAPACMQMLRDLDHPFARGEKVYDVTFENVQAGERTSHLFRLAGQNQAMVVGTGDLSELALGWCTYGVGDQMSHYNVNASVPKTLIRHLIGWVATRSECKAETSEVLRAVLDTPISPELVPGDDAQGYPAQVTEDLIGPYELHDFSLYYLTRRGYSPAKVAYLACEAFTKGPDPAYTEAQVFDWLEVFLKRFFGSSQFKRSAMPNGPKVGSGGSLSPRGDWRAPSDASARTWLDALAKARTWAEPKDSDSKQES